MGFELGRLVREAAGEIGERVAEMARELRKRAQAQAGRMWRDVEARLRIEKTEEVQGSAADLSCQEPNAVVGRCTLAVIETMVEVLSLSGYEAIQADISGRQPPEIIRGTMRSHRPSLTATCAGQPVLVDVFVPSEMAPALQLSRWQLFASAADQFGGEFQVVVPCWMEGCSGKEWVRRVTDATGIKVAKIWEM